MADTRYEIWKKLQVRLQTDPEHQTLENVRRGAEPGFLAMLETLDPQQQETLVNYFGILQELDLRALEVACFLLDETVETDDP